jgi:hypothetical protein
MMLAQGLGEYGAVGGGGGGGAFSSLASLLQPLKALCETPNHVRGSSRPSARSSSGSCSCGHDGRRGSRAVSEVRVSANS